MLSLTMNYYDRNNCWLNNDHQAKKTWFLIKFSDSCRVNFFQFPNSPLEGATIQEKAHTVHLFRTIKYTKNTNFFLTIFKFLLRLHFFLVFSWSSTWYHCRKNIVAFNIIELSRSPYTVSMEIDKTHSCQNWKNRNVHMNCNVSPGWLFDICHRGKETKKKFASSGNRTRAARVAGEHSTTEPTMQCTAHRQISMPAHSTFKVKVWKTFAVGRIRTYAPRGKLISSQSP